MGYVEIAGAGLIWATSGPLVRGLVKAGFHPWDIVLARALFSLVFLGAWLVLGPHIRKGPNSRSAGTIPHRSDIPVLLTSGLFAVVLSQTSYFYALSTISVATAVTLNYTAPFFVMVISYLLYRQPLTSQKLLGLAGAVTGVAIVSGFIGPAEARGDMNVVGVLAGLLSGFAYGSQTVLYKHVGVRYDPIPLNFWTMATGAAELGLVLTVVNRKVPDALVMITTATPEVWRLLFLIGIGPGTLAFILFADGINKVDPARGAIVAMTEPVFACLIGYLLLGESLTLLQVLGIGLVVGSIWGVSVGKDSPARDRGMPTAATRSR